MASEHNVPAIPTVAAEPIAHNPESVPGNTGLQPTSLTPGQESRDPFSSREGSVRRDESPPVISSPAVHPSQPQPASAPSPSDMERGMALGYSSPRPELNPLNTRARAPGLGSDHPLPSPPPILRRPTGDYDPQPRGNNSPRSQRDDPFSPRGSPHDSQQSNPRSRSQNNSPRGQGRDDARDQLIGASSATREENRTNAQIGGHLRHVLGDEGSRLVGRLHGHQTVDPNTSEGFGGRLRHALEEEGDELLNRIPGAHQHDASRANEGFGARLRHAAEDYIHDNLPALPGRIHHTGDDVSDHTRRSRAMDPHLSRTHSVIDHIVPVQHVSDIYLEKERYIPGSVSARLQATLKQAEEEKDKYATKAKYTGWALNIAIGLQVLLGSLTTGLSAVATQGKSAAVSTTILGALATVVASYLARARGSNEPELSITRVKDLEQFIRECKNFQTDHGDDTSHDYDAHIEGYRNRFESLLGNANGERKLSSAGVQPSQHTVHTHPVKQQ